jgi:hypothetical protein
MQSSRRGDLQNQLTMRQAAGAAVKRAQDETVKAAGRLRTIADRCQIREDGDETAIVGRLHAWLRSRAEAAAAYQTACREWAELQELIGGRNLGQLQSEALRRRQFANEKRAGLDPRDLASTESIYRAQLWPGFAESKSARAKRMAKATAKRK